MATASMKIFNRTISQLRVLGFGTLLFLAGAPAIAGEIKGAGAGSCGAWVEDRKTDTWYPQIHWIQGYLSAYNVYAYKGRDDNGVFGRADAKALAVWLDNYCSSNPLKSPAHGMSKLIQELEQQQR